MPPAALAQWRAGRRGRSGAARAPDRPTPRVALGLALAGIAHAGIDVSDGLLADLGHVCTASGVGAEIDLDALPASPRCARIRCRRARRVLQAGGGDDYELCFTAPPTQRDAIAAVARDAGVAITRIGRIVAGMACVPCDADGSQWQPPHGGYVHFA